MKMNNRIAPREIPLLSKWILAFLLSAALPQVAAADEDSRRSGPYLELFGGLNYVPDEDFSASGSERFQDGEASFDSGFITGLAAGYRLNPEFAFELEYAYRSNDVDKIAGSGGTTVNGGDLASVAIMANAYYFPPLSNRVLPYVGLGLGLMQEVDADLELRDGGSLKDLEDSGVAWQAMLGVEVPFADAWYLSAEGRFTSAPGPEISNDEGSFDFDYNNLGLMFGVGYQF